MVDLKRYHRLRPDGLCWVGQRNGIPVVNFKRFDNETGKELPPEYLIVDVGELEKERIELNNKLEAADLILKATKELPS